MVFLYLLALRLNGTYKSFHDHINNYPEVPLISFLFAPWCQHCQKEHPIFDKVSDKFENSTQIAFMAVNCTEEKELCEECKLEYFPTFILSYYNSSFDIQVYPGEKDLHKVVSKVMSVKDRVYERVSNEKKEIKDIPIFKFFVNPNDEESKKLIDIECLKLGHVDFKHFQVTYSLKTEVGKPKFLIQVDEDFSFEIKDELTPEKIDELAKEYSFPIFSRWNTRFLRTFKRDFAALVSKDKNDYIKYRPIAHKYYEKFAWGDKSGLTDNNLHKKYLNMTDKDLPAIVIINNKVTNYTLFKNINVKENLLAFKEAAETGEYERKDLIIDYSHESSVAILREVGFYTIIIIGGMIVLSIVLYYVSSYTKSKEEDKWKLE